MLWSVLHSVTNTRGSLVCKEERCLQLTDLEAGSPRLGSAICLGSGEASWPRESVGELGDVTGTRDQGPGRGQSPLFQNSLLMRTNQGPMRAALVPPIGSRGVLPPMTYDFLWAPPLKGATASKLPH